MRSVAAGWRVYKLPDVPVRHFAEQLTRMDVVCKNVIINFYFALGLVIIVEFKNLLISM